MKQDIIQKVYLGIFLLILMIIAINLTIDNTQPDIFVCKDNFIAKQIQPIDIRGISEACFDKCEHNNPECLDKCVELVEVLVEAN